MRNKINTIITSMLLVLCVTVLMFAVNVSAAEETTTPIDNCDRIIEAYDLDDAEGYINDGDASTYPTTDTEGYIFAGWYTDEACGEDSYWGQEEPGDTVYALFVPSHILSVKAQVSSNLLDGDISNNSSASIRFVTTVDTLLYNKAGFELSYIGSDGTTKSATSSSNKVYKKLYAIGSTSEEYTEDDVMEYTPEGSFCGLSTYFKACTVNSIGSDYFATAFTVKPFWRTLDGSIVYGETAIKTINDYFSEKEKDVWVSSIDANAADTVENGSEEKPFKTLEYALSMVKNEGTIHIKDSYIATSDFVWKDHDKTVTVTGGTLDFTALPVVTIEEATEDAEAETAVMLHINDSVKFTGTTLTFVDGQHVYANGNKVEIASDVTWGNSSAYVWIYGGAYRTALKSDTNLVLSAGNYKRVFGGGNYNSLTGDVNVTLSGTINGGLDGGINYKNHTLTYAAFGGGENGCTVTGDINFTIGVESTDEVLFDYIYGGGFGSTVKGDITVKYSGYAMSVFGGCRGGSLTGDTQLIMSGGYVEQLFGGSQGKSMTGNTDVRVLGGTVDRRIYGGCYNDASEDYSLALNWPPVELALTWDTTNYQVNGYTSVTIVDKEALQFEYTKSVTKYNYTITSASDNSLYAVSRNGTPFANERGVLIFNNNLYDSCVDKIGYENGEFGELGLDSYFSTLYYNYLVIANEGGAVYSEGDSIRIVPDTASGMKATVRLGSTDGEIIHYTESESVCELQPKLASETDTQVIYVVFTDSTPSDVSVENYKAKIGDGYYLTVESAVAAANATSTEETVTVTVLKDAEITSHMEITGNVTITNLEGANVTISRAADLTSGNVFSVSSGATLNIVGTTDENSIVLDGKEVSSTASLIHSETGSALLVKNTTFKNAINTNTSTASGTSGTSGAIYATGTTLEVENSKFVGNTGTYGGAVRVAASTTAIITNSVFGEKGEGNVATKDGGAIYNQSTKGMTIVDSQIMCNTAPRAGALYNNGGTAVVKNSKFANNTATSTTNGSGGAIYNASSAKLTLTAQNGDGNSELASFVNNVSGDARAAYGGGAICIGSGTLNITGYRFEGNHATVSGGAVCVRAGSKTTIKNATFSGNYTTGANGYGGAIWVQKANTTIANAIFTENYTSGSEAHGGAVYLASEAASTVITNPTYADNAVIGEGAEGPDIYIEGIGSGTTPAGGLNGTDLGSGGEDDEIIEF